MVVNRRFPVVMSVQTHEDPGNDEFAAPSSFSGVRASIRETVDAAGEASGGGIINRKAPARSMLAATGGGMDNDSLDPAGKDDGDVRLAARALSGDAGAWEAIVERHWKSVWNLSRRIVRDQHGAEEVTQETFLLIQERLAEYRGEGPLCGWIQAICRRQSFDELRRRGRLARVVSIEDCLDPGGRCVAPAEDGWVRHLDLERALASLDDDEREALLMTAAGYTSEELGQMLSVAPTTVRSRRARARTRMTRELESGYGGRSQ
jgi:RNA polymerase sigma-70 factor (ECF subfamily)